MDTVSIDNLHFNNRERVGVVGLPFLSATYVGIPRAQHPWRGRDGVLQALKMLTEPLEFQVSSGTNLSWVALAWSSSAMNDAGGNSTVRKPELHQKLEGEPTHAQNRS
jgi:hypothetical protein